MEYGYTLKLHRPILDTDSPLAAERVVAGAAVVVDGLVAVVISSVLLTFSEHFWVFHALWD